MLAASVHPDGMVYPEAMIGLWVAAALLIAPLAFRRTSRARWRLVLGTGLLLGLAMLTKISAVVVIASIGVAAVVEFFCSGRRLRTRVGELLGWSVLPVAVLAVCGWYFARNVRDYGRPFVTSFDLPSQHRLVAPFNDVPGLDWSQNRPITARLLAASRYAVAGGTAIFMATLVTWCRSTVVVLSRKDFGLLALLLVPALTLGAAVQFATLAPVDPYGVVKGVYMQFGAPPLYALFGLSVACATRERRRWPVAAGLLIALWFVACWC